MKIRVVENILKANDSLALDNRAYFKSRGIKVVNLIGSPGSGKTSFIIKAAALLSERGLVCGVIEGDIASSIDAEKISSAGIPVVQVNTGGGCHLDAGMVKACLSSLPLDKINILFIENIGNLVCPFGYYLGEDLRITLLSVPEGDDKPLKYPASVLDTDMIIISKTDLEKVCGVRASSIAANARRIKKDVPLFRISARLGTGMAGAVGHLIKFNSTRRPT